MTQNITTAQQAQRRADQMRAKAYQDMLILNEEPEHRHRL
jgi:hypothetical protein